MDRLSRRSLLKHAGATALGITGASTLLAPRPALAAYPQRPVRLIVPFAAGGPTDQLARLFAQRLTTQLGQQVVVENKPGANSAIAVQTTTQSGSDGYTVIFLGPGALIVSPMLYKKLPYNPERDLTPVGLVANMPLVMVVNSDLPVTNVAEFIAYAKARPGQLNFGSPGNGNPLHLAVEMFNLGAGIRMQHVPFNGTAPALVSLRSGQIQTVFDVVSSALPHIQAGTLRALAVTTRQRSTALPNVPTMIESGIKDYEAASWFAITTTSDAPAEVKERLNQATQAVVKDPEFAPAMEKLGLIAYPPMSQAQIGQYVEAERKRWGTVIRTNNLSLD